jgi:hypothetical protein
VTSSVTFSEALRTGLSRAVASWTATLSLFGARAAEATIAVLMGGLLATDVHGRGARAALGGMATAWVLSGVVRALAVAGALRQAQARARGQGCGTLPNEASRVAGRALTFAVLSTAAELSVRGIFLLSVWGSGAAYVAGVLGAPSGFVLPAFTLATAWCLAAVVPWAIRLWLEVGFARLLRRDEPVTHSLFETAGFLSRRLGAPLGLWLTTGLLSLTYRMVVALMASGLPGAWEPGGFTAGALAGRIVAALVASYVPALLEMSRFHAFAALDEGGAGEAAVAVSPLMPVF